MTYVLLRLCVVNAVWCCAKCRMWKSHWLCESCMFVSSSVKLCQKWDQLGCHVGRYSKMQTTLTNNRNFLLPSPSAQIYASKYNRKYFSHLSCRPTSTYHWKFLTASAQVPTMLLQRTIQLRQKSSMTSHHLCRKCRCVFNPPTS